MTIEVFDLGMRLRAHATQSVQHRMVRAPVATQSTLVAVGVTPGKTPKISVSRFEAGKLAPSVTAAGADGLRLILDGSDKDRWFRPSVVCVATDGSLIVADWYDPGVGGHGMGDLTRGRLFRVTVPGAEKYEVKPVHVDSVEGAVEALKSPNEATRYLAWTALKGFGAKAEPALKELFFEKKAEPQHRARALWLWGQVNPDEAVKTALGYGNPLLRVVALRLARQLWQQTQPTKLRESVAAVPLHVAKESPEVNREMVIALRYDESKTANELWASCARQFSIDDRWALEALGISGDGHWRARLAACFLAKGDDLPATKELIQNIELACRSRDAGR